MILRREIQIVLGGSLIDALFYFLAQESYEIAKVMLLWTVSPKGCVVLFISFKWYLTPCQIFLFFIFINCSFFLSPFLFPFLSFPFLLPFLPFFLFSPSPLPPQISQFCFTCFLTRSLPLEAKLALSSLGSQGCPQTPLTSCLPLTSEFTNVNHQAQFQVKFPSPLEGRRKIHRILWFSLFLDTFSSPWVSNSSVHKNL